jgi:hypothetical protein
MIYYKNIYSAEYSIIRRNSGRKSRRLQQLKFIFSEKAKFPKITHFEFCRPEFPVQNLKK